MPAKNYEHLCAEERAVIMTMKSQGTSARRIAALLRRAPSTISRELRRNGYRSEPACSPQGVQLGRPRLRPLLAGGYDAAGAGRRAHRLRHRARMQRKLHPRGPLWPQVFAHLQHGLSPEQVACTLRLEHPDAPHLQASHQSIYSAIYAYPRGSLRRELVALLRQAHSTRKPRTRGQDRRGQLQDMLSIHVRPPEANERLLPGHWEGDLIKGAANRSAVGTLVCRKSLFVMLAKMDGSTAEQALKGYGQAFAPLPPELRQTLTYDQGKEMALHKVLSEGAGMRIYFCDPHSPWQRGICENTNGLLRQYLPKGTDLSVFSQRDLDHIAWRMNTRPRKTLGWKTPAQVLFTECLQSNIEVSPLVALGI